MLTDDMTRLCGEILAMRGTRHGLMNELQRDGKGRKRAVVELCAHFGRARTTMAKRTKNERVAFLNDLKRSVGAQRRDMRNDLAGARRVWAGKSS
jgi:hypothetical protein